MCPNVCVISGGRPAEPAPWQGVYETGLYGLGGQCHYRPNIYRPSGDGYDGWNAARLGPSGCETAS